MKVLEYADVAGADLLRAYCLAVAVCNLDSVLLEARGAFEELPQHLLVEMERIWKLILSGALPAQSSSAIDMPVVHSASAGSLPQENWHQEEADAQHGHVEQDGRTSDPVIPFGSRMQPGMRPTAAAPSLGTKLAGIKMWQTSSQYRHIEEQCHLRVLQTCEPVLCRFKRGQV